MTFTVEATGTQPLKYQWEWKPKKKWGRSAKWHPCDTEWCDGATLTIPKVEKSHTGSYHCVISNEVGSQTLTYQWQWKPAEEEGGGVEWQSCPAEWSDGAAILIPMEKSSEGSYHCVVSNCAGRQTSESAKLNDVSY